MYYNDCSEFNEEVRALNEEICATHNAHYQQDPEYGLVNPNNDADHVYHLYSDGELTHQKGGFCYQRRTEFTEKSKFFGCPTVFTLPKTTTRGYNYAILTEAEGVLLCNKMIRIHNKYVSEPLFRCDYIRPIWPKDKIEEMMRKVNQDVSIAEEK